MPILVTEEETMAKLVVENVIGGLLKASGG